MNDLTHDDVAALLSYDPETGALTWKVSRGTVKAGDVAGRGNGHGYRQIGVKGRSYLAHRLAFLLMTGKWPTLFVDHLNGQRDDNRWSNLREASNEINQQNITQAQKNSATGLLGVVPFRGRFKAQITANGQNRHLGTYDSAEVAHAVYVAAKRLLHEGNTL